MIRFDHKLVWDPEDFGGVNLLHVPSTHIWLPDIVLYNKYDHHIDESGHVVDIDDEMLGNFASYSFQHNSCKVRNETN